MAHGYLWSEEMHLVKPPGFWGVVNSFGGLGRGKVLSGEAAFCNAGSESFYLLFWALGSRGV